MVNIIKLKHIEFLIFVTFVFKEHYWNVCVRICSDGVDCLQLDNWIGSPFVGFSGLNTVLLVLDIAVVGLLFYPAAVAILLFLEDFDAIFFDSHLKISLI